MTMTQAVIKALDEELAKRHMSRRQLAKEAGLSTGTISSIYKQLSKSVTLNTLDAICKGLGMTMSEFLDNPCFKDVETKHTAAV